jgi:predicted PurR-regulated permease PerM
VSTDEHDLQQASKAAQGARAAAEDARDEAREAAADARQEAETAESSAAAADRASTDAEDAEAAAEDAEAAAEDLLIEHVADQDAPNPFGEPGPPLERHSPVYIGFFGGIGVVLAFWLAYLVMLASSVLVLVLVAMFIAVGLNPIVDWLVRHNVRRVWSVAIVSLGVFAVLGLFAISIVPVLVDQISTIIHTAPSWLDSLGHNRAIRNLDDKYDITANLKQQITGGGVATAVAGGLIGLGKFVVNAVFNVFVIFVLTLYFLAALPAIKRAGYSLAPASRRERVGKLGDEILARVGGYVAGAVLIAVCAGVSSAIFLTIVGLGAYAVALAVVVAILDFIPLIGATIGAVIVSAIGFATEPHIGILCVVFYVVYQQVENYLIYPRVMSSSVDVPPAVTVIAALVGGTLLGIVGALLAIPSAAAILLIVREVVVKRQDEL